VLELLREIPIPNFPFPEIRFPEPEAVPPIRLFVQFNPTKIPLMFGRAPVPVRSVPM
jgi:hypothetical protein